MKYDVFISYNSKDSTLAKELYDYLIGCGLSVFYSDVTLKRLGASAYSEAIDAALDESAHMVVIASRLSYLRQGWVFYEWNAFSNELKSGRKKGNLITVVPSDIKVGDLPLGLRHRQFLPLEHYADDILNYLGESVEKTPDKPIWRNFYVLAGCACVCLLVVLFFVFYHVVSEYRTPEYPEGFDSYMVDYSDSSSLSQAMAVLSYMVDSERILLCFKEAVAGNSEAQYELGNFCYDCGNYNDAIYWFSLSAKQGNPRAANGLGRCYYNAAGVRRRPINAFNWFRFSAAHGCPEGMNNVGKCYDEGFGRIIPSQRKATECYFKAAEMSSVPAMFNLGITYLFEDKNAKNDDQGLNMLRRAAFLGSPSAQLALGNIYRDGKFGIEQDSTEAVKWYRKAMTNNDEEVMRSAQMEMSRIR